MSATTHYEEAVKEWSLAKRDLARREVEYMVAHPELDWTNPRTRAMFAVENKDLVEEVDALASEVDFLGAQLQRQYIDATSRTADVLEAQRGQGTPMIQLPPEFSYSKPWPYQPDEPVELIPYQPDEPEPNDAAEQ